jgi:hypothetical protein
MSAKLLILLGTKIFRARDPENGFLRPVAAAALATAVLALAGCKTGSSPPTNARAAVSMDPARWSFQASPGMPPSPSSCGDGTQWCFDFPSRDGLQYLVTPVAGFVAGTMTAKFHIEADAGATFRESDPCGDRHQASVRLYFQRRGDQLTARYEDWRWWSNPAHVVLANGTHVLSAQLAASEWSQVYGKKGDTRAQAFAAAAGDVQALGVTFGGCFFGHGAYVTGGSARFVMTGFTVR